MMVSASAYNTLSGPFRDLSLYAQSLVDSGELLDFSIFQMQPWLDVSEPNSATVAIANDPEKAERYAHDLAERLYGLRHAFAPKLSSIDFIIDRAEEPTASKPVILVDSADSPNAGAPGDSMAVARASARATIDGAVRHSGQRSRRGCAGVRGRRRRRRPSSPSEAMSI